MNLPARPSSGRVLGVRVDALDYAGAVAHADALSQSGQPAAVAAANTHLVTEARLDGGFAEVLESFALVLPDGMPLVWLLRRQGFALADRCYGPWFFREALKTLPQARRHVFFGGKTETLEKLKEAALKLRPDLQVADLISPPFGPWSPGVEAALVARIKEARPDFVWVALGGVRQETWIHRHLPEFGHGVFVGIGDGFALLAGEREPAPDWMQRAGLTWLHRLAKDPRRLAGRYLKYNSLFLWFGLPEWLFPPGRKVKK